MDAFPSLWLLPPATSAHSTKLPSLISSQIFFPYLIGCRSLPAAKATPLSRRGRSSRDFIAPSAVSRRVLSEGWDLYTSASGSAWLPRLDDLDTTNMLLKQRIVFLGSQVDDMTADLIVSQLLFLDAEDEKMDIKLFINSPGGSVTAGMGIYDAMKLCKADVSTICLGLAASMGAFLLASGTKGKRFCMPNARVMIHQPLGTAGGNALHNIIPCDMPHNLISCSKLLTPPVPYKLILLEDESRTRSSSCLLLLFDADGSSRVLLLFNTDGCCSSSTSTGAAPLRRLWFLTDGSSCLDMFLLKHNII